MELIIGGAFQGKEALAKKQYPALLWKPAEELSKEELGTTPGILHFEKWIRKSIEAGESVDNLAEYLINNNPNAILVCDEVGYGVVPMDAVDRAYREAVGRVCTKLAAYSHKVTRVICGVGTVIKDA